MRHRERIERYSKSNRAVADVAHVITGKITKIIFIIHCFTALNNRVSIQTKSRFHTYLLLRLLTIADRNRKHISTGGRRLRWAAAAAASRHQLVSVLEFLQQPDWRPEDQSNRRARPIKLREVDQVSKLNLLFCC